MKIENNHEKMTVKEMADYLRIGLTSAYNLIRQKNFPAVKIGGKYLIDNELLDLWIKEQKERNAV